jgi:hypothetical protein
MLDFLIEAAYWVMEAVLWRRIGTDEKKAYVRPPRRRQEERTRQDD